jgi:putative transposase
MEDGMARKKKDPPEFPPAALDALLAGVKSPADLEVVFRQMKKALVERALQAELTEHLGYEPGEPKPPGQPNHRNGTTPKTVLTDTDQIPLDIPRDRAGSFVPQLVPKGLRRLPGFDQKVLSLYARGLTVREIRAHLEELYQVEVAPAVISAVTEAVREEVTAWQQRPLEPLYPVVVFDALRVKIRDEGLVRSKAVYLALGITREGQKDVLGLWVEQTEGAKFWLRVFSELRSRGVADILVALIDGLPGFPEAIVTVFPQTQIHQCIVHLMRRSLDYVSWRERKAVAAALRHLYRAESAAAAEATLEAFAQGPYGQRFPAIVQLWRRAWPHVVPIYAYPPALRRVLSTTNALESLHSQLRKATRVRGHFPSDEAATKLLYLVLRNVLAKWQLPAPEWKAAMPVFALLFGERFDLGT